MIEQILHYELQHYEELEILSWSKSSLKLQNTLQIIESCQKIKLPLLVTSLILILNILTIFKYDVHNDICMYDECIFHIVFMVFIFGKL